MHPLADARHPASAQVSPKRLRRWLDLYPRPRRAVRLQPIRPDRLTAQETGSPLFRIRRAMVCNKTRCNMQLTACNTPGGKTSCVCLGATVRSKPWGVQRGNLHRTRVCVRVFVRVFVCVCVCVCVYKHTHPHTHAHTHTHTQTHTLNLPNAGATAAQPT